MNVVIVRSVFFSHDGLGLGHATRNRRIAVRLAEDHGGEAVLACGVDLPGPLPFGVDVFRLPALRRVGSGQYEARYLRRSSDDVVGLRSELFESMVIAFKPDIIVVDRHPFGVNQELVRGLDRSRSAGGRLILGLRDILDSPERVAREWSPEMLSRIAEYYDVVIVYGNREWFDPVREYSWPRSIAEKVQFAGMVGAGHPNATVRARRAGDERPFVVASVGGGADGYPLLDAFLRAAVGRDWHGVVAVGPDMPADDVRSLRSLAQAAGMRVSAFERELPGILAASDLAVTMAGANTVAEVLEAGCRSVVVPRAGHRFEQRLRALALERIGRSIAVPFENLSADRLGQAMDEALSMPQPQPLDLNGAARAAEIVVETAKSR